MRVVCGDRLLKTSTTASKREPVVFLFLEEQKELRVES